MPQRFPQETTLRDGRRVILRPFTEKDTDALWTFFEHLPTTYRRFAWDAIDNRATIDDVFEFNPRAHSGAHECHEHECSRLQYRG